MSSEKNSCTPNLRFPGFTGEWTEELLGNIIDVSKGKQINNTELTDDTTLFPMLNGGASPSGYYKDFNTPANSITISEGGNSCGYVNFMKVPFWAGGHCYIVKSIVDINHDFLYHALKSKESDLMKLRVGSGLPNIQRKTLLNEVSLPFTSSKKEQEEIATFLSEIDALISAQDQKVERLKEHKTGLMQQLFPQPGETTPCLRFPEFSGEWEEKTLGSIAKKVNLRNSKMEITRVLTNSANSGIVDQNDYFDRSIAVKENTANYHIVDINEFVYNPRISSAAPVGPISINKIGKGIMSPLYTIFRFHTGCVSFYEQYFQTTIWHPYLKSIANFGARFDRMNITSEGFFNMPLYIPSYAEQRIIADFLSNFDSLISDEEARLESLKVHKKGLMQQLFQTPSK